MAFVITATGDTDDREARPFGFSTEHESASIEIDGVGTFDFISATRTFVNNDFGTVGFSRAGGGASDLFNGPHGQPDFETWDMLNSIGPLSGDDGVIITWDRDPVETTGGILVIDEEFDVSVTFTATVVPTAPSIALLGPAALLVTRYARRRR